MSCDYCKSIGVVGGSMPWPNGTSHAAPCDYCTSSPALKFKPGVTPWTGSIMPVPEWDGSTEMPAHSLYAEPDLGGERVIVVIDPTCRMWCWGEGGKYAMSKMLQAELTVLATDVMFEGHAEYACGIAIEGLIVDGDLWIYMMVPLLSLLDGVDTHHLGTRRLDLEIAVKRVGDALSYTLIPRTMMFARKVLDQKAIDRACDNLGTDSIMVKQVQGHWGVTPCWVRAKREEDF